MTKNDDKKLTLTVKYAAQQATEEFNANQKVSHVRDVAWKKFGLSKDDAAKLEIYLVVPGGTNQQLQPDAKLGESGVKDNDSILLQAPTQIYGA